MEKLRHFYGNTFMEYCLNLSTDEFSDRRIQFTNQQNEVIEALQATIRGIEAHSGDETIRRFNLAATLSYSESHGSSPANAWRLHCGGEIPTIQSDDSLEMNLLLLGVDTYPQLLLPNASGDDRMPFTGVMTFNNPNHRRTVKEILLDRDLHRLFPGVTDSESYQGDGIDITSEVIWSNGSGGGLQLAMLPESIIRYSTLRLRDPSTLEQFLNALRNALTLARTLARKKETAIPGLIGMAHIELSNTPMIEFEGGEIRKPSSRDSQCLMGAEHVTAILEVSAPIKLLSIRGPSSTAGDSHNADHWARWDTHQSDFEKHRRKFRRTVDLARLALLLSSPAEKYIAPTEVASTVLNPLAYGMSVGVSHLRNPVSMFGSCALDEEVARSVQAWSLRLTEHPPKLDMTMRRLLSSVSSRLSPMDAFVDAVVCWENMFGTGEGEVVFRLSGALAHLLQPNDRAARKELFDEVKSLYSIRSKLVHGAAEPSDQDAIGHMNRSIDIAMQALSKLYDHPELLKANDSSVRGRMILIGS
ncbi:HEPN domain-containing protein [Streptomyces clavifer]|uniref:hypothetical protein n=1 Tax=Streptomyces clavifer TaxID=68188 RepID=UPI002E82340D|nr:hypothetical protein [Streptomyces clavifer]WUC29403.1 HEPN domain-containing protein [Streptomyces clavifer]